MTAISLFSPTQVPDYKNDFPDWEVDSWLSSFSTPYVPNFLLFGALSLVVLLVLAAIVMVRRKKNEERNGDDEQSSPLWL